MGSMYLPVKHSANMSPAIQVLQQIETTILQFVHIGES